MKKLLTEWRRFLKEQQPVVAKKALGGDELALGALSALGPFGAAIAAGIETGVTIGIRINVSIDLIKDVMKNKRIKRMYSANPNDIVANIERLKKQSQTKGVNESEAEELVHSWISLAGKNKQAAKKYVPFLKLLKASKASKVFPPYIQLK